MSEKISQMPPASALTGAELVPLVQGGDNVRSTTQDIADLGGGGGTPTLAAVLVVGNDANGLEIENLLDPTTDQAAATKKYVDDNAGGGGLQGVITAGPILTDDNEIIESGKRLTFAQNISTNKATITNIYGTINTSSTAIVSNPMGLYSELNVDGSGLIGGANATGVGTRLNVGASGDIGVYSGFQLYPTNTSAGSTIGYLEGISIDGFTNNADIGTAYGYFYGGITNAAGSIDNHYGFYIEDITGGSTDNYAIYTKAGNIHFGGIPEYANRTAALAAGLTTGNLYSLPITGDNKEICIV